ncbi:MAG: hypothetical protein JW732_03890 [Dehalococcoidia bacterium]|nr:hypothetical protein [Dehalococcoidia bacterium]
MERPLIINDHDKIEEVYKRSEEYLKNHNVLQEEIATYLWAYHQVGDLVPQTIESFWSGHFFPFAESYYELENSFELCKQGFYRHSLFALRCVLELAVIGLYFDKDDQAHMDVQKWLHSEDPTPHFQKSLMRLFELEYYRLFNEKFALQQEIKDIYSVLSDFVHSRGYAYSTTGQSLSNFNQFNESSLRRYVEIMKKVVKGIITMLLLKYPIGMRELPLWGKFGLNSPVGGFLDESSQHWVLTILDEDTKEVLQSISSNDPLVNEAVRHILVMPDLTEEQLKKQRAEWDDIMEKHDAKKQKTDGDV